MNLRHARLHDDDHVSCWNCPASLAQIVHGLEEPRVLAVPGYYRSAPIPAALAELGIRAVLIIPPKVRGRLAVGRLPGGRRMRMDEHGKVRPPRSGIFPMPLLMPCRRPSCGALNHVVDRPLADGA